MSEWTGTVVAKSENGIKVVDKGAWLNWSLPDYRGTPFDSNVKAGDRVRIEYAEVEKNGEKRTYISVIENLSRPSVDVPFPPEDDFPPDDIMPPDAPGAPSEATIDKDRLIVRQVAAKCAVEALGPYPYHAEDSEMRRWEGALLHLMATIEDNVYRSGDN